MITTLILPSVEHDKTNTVAEIDHDHPRRNGGIFCGGKI